jgi:hypothetical protein
MRNRSTLLAAAMMALGGLLGYAAASGQFTALWQAHAWSPSNPTRSCPGDGTGCCSDGLDKGLLLARAKGHEAREASDGEPANDGKKPNIVFVLMDNLGYGEVGCYGGGMLRGAPTPRIDKLASEGTRLLNFNVEAQCTPSRSAIMTGRFPIRSGTQSIPTGGEFDGLRK